MSGPTRTTGRFGGGLLVRRRQRLGDRRGRELARPDDGDDARGVGPARRARQLWRTVVLKEQPGQLAYALYAGTEPLRPSAHVFTTGDLGLLGPSALPLSTWSHLAMTWDGADRARLRQRRPGLEPARWPARRSTSTGRCGSAATASGREWFSGVIDEVRVYNRALERERDRHRPRRRRRRCDGRSSEREPCCSRQAKKARAKAKKARKAKRKADRRKTQKKVHRGTHWLKR